jgi:hypothetical protein
VSGACDDLSQSTFLGSPGSPVAAGSTGLLDLFGYNANAGSATGAINNGSNDTGAAAGKGFVSLQSDGTNHFIFIPGANGSPHSLTNSPLYGGDLRTITQWQPNEAHAFQVTIAYPDTGAILITDANGDKYNVSKDDRFQGGGLSFDLVWVATQ